MTAERLALLMTGWEGGNALRYTVPLCTYVRSVENDERRPPERRSMQQQSTAVAAADIAGFNFEAEKWEAPTKELRKLRSDFYAPLTQEMLDRAMAGEEGACDEPTTNPQPTAAALIARGKKALQHESVTIRAKGRWGKSIGRAKLNVKVGGALKSLGLDKWFISWQEKKCVHLPPVYKTPPGEEGTDEPMQEGGADATVDFGADDSEDDGGEDAMSTEMEKVDSRGTDDDIIASDGEDALLPSLDISSSKSTTEGGRDDEICQDFEVGDEVVLSKRLQKKKVIGDVLLPSQLCNITYGPDAKGDMKIKRQGDGKELRYVRARDIERTRATTGSPGMHKDSVKAGGNGAAAAKTGLATTAAASMVGGTQRGETRPFTFRGSILDSRGFLKKARQAALGGVAKEPQKVGIRLFCFPWEGANAGVFEPFSFHIKAALVVAVQYPGRMNRAKELAKSDVRELARSCVEAMLGQKLLDTPFAFLGHGVGALVAYECARIIRNKHNGSVKLPALFIAVQAEGPQSFDDDHGSEGLASETNEVAFQHIQSLERGGLPAEVTDQPALFSLALPLFRADTKAYESYRYESDWPFSSTPFYVLFGEYDGRYSRDTVQLWDQETTKEFELRMIPSGAREMFRDPVLIAETAAWVDAKIAFELRRPKVEREV